MYSVGAGNASVGILLDNAGTYTVLASSTTATVAAGDTVRCTVQGTSLTMTDQTTSATLLTASDTQSPAGIRSGRFCRHCRRHKLRHGELGRGIERGALAVGQLASDNFNRAMH